MSDMCNNLVGLFDRCYKHEAFSADQRHTLLHWRGPLCNKLQNSGKIEFKSMQSSSSSTSLNRRVQLKPQTSMGNMSTTQITKPAVRNIRSVQPYYSNYQSIPIPLSRQHNSETPIQNDLLSASSKSNESNIIRRPAKSPTFIFTSNNDSTDEAQAAHRHLSLHGTHSLQEQTSDPSAAGSFLVERSAFDTGNLRPSFQYVTSTPQRNTGTYLAANQHQLLTRKISIGPYSDNTMNDKTKLCKTFSDPSKIRFYNPTPSGNLPLSSVHGQTSPSQGMFRMASTSYSPQSNYLSQSQTIPSTSNDMAFHPSSMNESPIQKSYSDKDAALYYSRCFQAVSPEVHGSMILFLLPRHRSQRDDVFVDRP